MTCQRGSTGLGYVLEAIPMPDPRRRPKGPALEGIINGILISLVLWVLAIFIIYGLFKDNSPHQ